MTDATPDQQAKLADIMRAVQPAPKAITPCWTAAPPPNAEQMDQMLRDALQAAWRDMGDYRPPAAPATTAYQQPATDPLTELRAAINLLPQPLRYQRTRLAPADQLWVVDPPLTTRRLLILPTGPAGDRAIAVLEAAGVLLEPADGTEGDVPMYGAGFPPAAPADRSFWDRT